jgi:hypothetical protein
MKTTNKIHVCSFLFAFVASLFVGQAYAGNNHHDALDKMKLFDAIFYILAPTKDKGDKNIVITAKLGSPKRVAFQGIVEVPSSVHLAYGTAKQGHAGVEITFDDDIVCSYEARSSRRLLNNDYDLEDCSDGSRAKDRIRVRQGIELKLNRTLYNVALVKASIKVISRIQTGLEIPHLEAEVGQILRYDGDLWRPTDYIPDGESSGDVLTWDGTSWIAAASSGTGGGQGPQGEMGPQGPQGEVGEMGPQGPQGEMGPQGPQGEVGAMGPQGIQGLKGDKGDKGDAGAAGATGAQGPQGEVGAMGPQGIQGLKGDKGDKGDAGAVGATGAQGPQGEVGAMGPQGIQGLKGDKGDKGDTGATGAQGPVGPAGAQGPQGEMGATGPQGPQGATGLQGPAGADGAQGPQGEVGATGAQGPMGLPGVQGEVGPAGEKGEKGDPGIVELIAGPGIKPGTGAGGVINGYDSISVDVGINAGQIPQLDLTGRLPASVMPEMNAQVRVAYIKDIKPAGIPGGTCTALGWQVRDLNELTGDSSFVSLAGNQFTLQAGRYAIESMAPAFLDNVHKSLLYNINTSSMQIAGTTGRSHTVAGGVDYSHISGVIELTTATTFEIHHRCTAAKELAGFGLPAGFDGIDEVYTQVKLIKIE